MNDIYLYLYVVPEADAKQVVAAPNKATPLYTYTAIKVPFYFHFTQFGSLFNALVLVMNFLKTLLLQ
jgi:hypothetical protein